MDKKTYDSNYLEKINDLLQTTKQFSLSLLNLQNTDVIADIGCGNGLDLLNYAGQVSKVIAIDNDYKLLENAKENLKQIKNIDFLCCNANAISKPNKSIDKIRFDRVFQHIENYNEIIKESKRILKINGLLQIIDVDYFSMSLFLSNIEFEKKLFDYLVNNKLVGAKKIRDIPSILEQHNLKIINFEINNYTFRTFDLINYIIHLDKIVDEMFTNNQISKPELNYWKNLIKHNSDNFVLSLNIIIFQAINN